MAPMKVLISGAGVAGNSLAFWLSRLGHNVTVVERFPSLRTGGLQVDLRGHGITILKRMGLDEAFRAKAVPERGLQLVNSAGKRRAFFGANNSGKGTQSFTSQYEIMRGDLCRILQEASQDKVKYVFGTTIKTFEEKDGSVEVAFSDGETNRYDLLVGADGLGSHTRKLMLGPNPPQVSHRIDGYYTAYFTIPNQMKEDDMYLATAYLAPGGRGAMTRRHRPDQLQVYLGGRTDSKRLENARPGDTKEEQEALTEFLKGAGWQVDELLEAMKSTDNFYCERMAVIKMDSWSRGRVALVGDAAYCPSALTGMGTTSAIMGAYVLAGEIGRHCGKAAADGEGPGATEETLTAALKEYDHKFRPFIENAQKAVLDRKLEKFIPTSQFGITVASYLAGLFAFLKLDVLAGKLFPEQDTGGWDLPDYKELRD